MEISKEHVPLFCSWAFEYELRRFNQDIFVVHTCVQSVKKQLIVELIEMQNIAITAAVNYSVVGREPAIWGVQLERPELVTFVNVTNRRHHSNYSMIKWVLMNHDTPTRR